MAEHPKLASCVAHKALLQHHRHARSQASRSDTDSRGPDSWKKWWAWTSKRPHPGIPSEIFFGCHPRCQAVRLFRRGISSGVPIQLSSLRLNSESWKPQPLATSAFREAPRGRGRPTAPLLLLSQLAALPLQFGLLVEAPIDLPCLPSRRSV